MELCVEEEQRRCSACEKFKSRQAFYMQGTRHESICKGCKKESRKKRTSCRKPQAIEPQTPLAEPSRAETRQVRSFEDLGLTKDEFENVVEFWRERLRLSRL